MGVCAGETLTIRGEFAVENGSMTLALNLDEKHKITPRTKTEEWAKQTQHKGGVFHSTQPQCVPLHDFVLFLQELKVEFLK